MIVENHPQYAAQHQLAVLDCLEDPDESLQRKTLDLLYRMTNPVNVEFISEKLVAFLSGTTDLFLKKQLTTRVCSIAERHAPNNAWYIRTITQLFEVSGDMVSQDVAQNLMSLIAEGTGDSDEEDMLLRQNAVEIYVALLRDKPVGALPRILLETMAWCLGEYGYLSAVASLDEILQQLCEMARTHKTKLEPSTRRFLVSAIMKLVSQAGTCPPHAAAVIDGYTKARDIDLQQRCLEFQNILTNCANILPEIFPVDASAEDLDVDVNLSFLDGFVQEALANGARSYECPEDDDDEEDYMNGGVGHSTFNMTPYEKPQAPAQAMLAMSGLGSTGRSSHAGVSLPPGSFGAGPSKILPSQVATTQNGSLALNTHNVANVWGKGGLSQDKPQPSLPSAPPASSLNAFDSRFQGSTASSPYRGSSESYGSSTPALPSAPPVKTAAQLERERQAAALFGGIVPGAAPPIPTQMAAPVVPPPVPRPVISAPPVLAPTLAPEIDLLDMGAWDAPSAPSQDFDVVNAPAPPATMPPSPPRSAPASVETVVDDYEDEPEYVPAPADPEPVEDADPFANAGLLDDVLVKPLASFSLASNPQFEYNGTAMAPCQITTAEFGQRWGQCTATSPIQVTSNKITDLTTFMDVCGGLGAHKVEAISATNEGICAGMVGGSHICLIHGKIAPTGNGSARIDATVKGTDQSMCGSLAMYLQTQLR
jgi:AP-4 complex subunit epsilon-1